MSVKKYQECTKCVMDTSDEDIFFDKKGVCNYCNEFNNSKINVPNPDKLNKQIEKIKKDGKGHEYDCVIGLSGGVDSSYLAYIVKEEFGLRPLAVHLDNGWNDELAVKNIENIVRKLDIDLHTHVINWEEFKDIQLAYLKASVIDIEAITDHAIFAVLWEIANKNNIKHILLGLNRATEEIMPKSWTFNKNDITNLTDIQAKHGTMAIKTLPQMGLAKIIYYKHIKGMSSFSPLNYINFNKDEAKQFLIEKLGWRDYGGKHFESIFTRFYQGYILPRKFKIDKRRAHLASLINTNQISRDEALEILKQPPYSEKLVNEDYEYVIKKFGLTKEEMEKILNSPVNSHFKYKADIWSVILKKFLKPSNPIRLLARKLFIN
ncbi:MAG: hypothetical protein A2X02_01475 [Bacteroidetes bacterium GWF2_29_10]|nr:MAG: hypothetical protein A2X02_01475 [Bacteroidetes bacterium GWF2_29_10]